MQESSGCWFIISPLTMSLFIFISLLSYFEKNRVGLWDHVAVFMCVCLCIPPIVARQRLGKIPIVARQKFDKNPLSLVGNGSVKIPLSLIGNGSVKIPLSLIGNGSVKIPLSLLSNDLLYIVWWHGNCGLYIWKYMKCSWHSCFFSNRVTEKEHWNHQYT
jgi:hypothetical protein